MQISNEIDILEFLEIVYIISKLYLLKASYTFVVFFIDRFENIKKHEYKCQNIKFIRNVFEVSWK